MSLDKIQKLVGTLSKSLEDNEQLATPILAAKLARCVAAYPGDQTLGAMSRVIGKMAENNTLFIRKAELRSLYTKLYSRNTKFAELFEDEIGKVNKESSVTTMQRDDAQTLDTYKIADPILANALPSVFDKHLPVKMYSKTLADQALRSVGTSLDSWGLKPASLSVDDGNDKFLVIKADYETPKGVTSFYVPVEVRNNKVAEATVFMGNSGPQDLNHLTIKQYVTSQAGNKLKVNSTTILGALVSAAAGNREITQTELALTKLNAKRQGKSEFFEGAIVGQKMVEAAKEDVKLPKLAIANDFEEKFNTPKGLASWKFGEKNVAAGLSYLTRELTTLGHKNPQVTVTGNDDTTIFYGISLNAGRVAFTVPIKLSNGKLNKPNVLICNGSIGTFDAEGINQLYVNNQTDFKVAAAASPQFGLKPSELLSNIRQALSEGNNAKAEDALNVLASTGDQKAYAIGFDLFKQGLLGKTAKVESKCTHIVKNSKHAVSEHPVCGQTGLPVHKVYQDKHGNCRPLYRQGMDETYEGASFLNSKIFG